MLVSGVRIGLALALLLAPAVQAQLNDSGQTTCYNDTAATGTVSPATPTPVDPGFERQDCVRGRDAAAALGLLPKVGTGAAGFDFTKIAHDGSVLPADAALGPGPGDWACTRDNVTGLVWEIKTVDGGLRDTNHTYTWYDTDTEINGGNAGDQGSNTCGGTLPGGLCNTSALVAAVNALTAGDRLCGATDWRMPSRPELASIVHYGVSSPAIDVGLFPNTVPFSNYWTGESYASDPSTARVVHSGAGDHNAVGRTVSYPVRLVRGGP